MGTWSRKVTRSSGIDDTMQGIGTDPSTTPTGDRLRVPTLSGVRYLFSLCGFQVPESMCGKVRITGFRQGLWLVAKFTADNGVTQYKWMPVGGKNGDPHWRPQDGNVEWHFYRTYDNHVPIPQVVGPEPVTGFESVKFRFAKGPALLYETIAIPAAEAFYVGLTEYGPPNEGLPFGVPFQGGQLKTLYSVEQPWDSPSASDCLSIECDQPGWYGMYAGVLQTVGSHLALAAPPNPFFPLGMTAEDQFVQNFSPTTPVQFGAVAGEMYYEILEDD